jgi:CheY-like chemotaxis protein
MKAATAQNKPYAAVVTDFEMPGMNGRELIQSLSSSEIGRPFIALMSALPKEELDRDRAAIPCDLFLRKPVDYVALDSAIKAHFS